MNPTYAPARRKRYRPALAPLIAVALFVPSCGSGSGTASAPATFGADFAQKAAKLCQQVLAEKKAEPPFPFAHFNPTAPDVAELPAIGHYEHAGTAIFQSWLTKMRQLGPPPKGGTTWAALLAPIDAHARIIADQERAADRSDAKTFTADYYAGNNAQKQMAKAAKEAGLRVCATAAGA